MTNTTLFKCPSCGAALFQDGKSYQCENKHNFDIAKSGYVNLLLAHHKKSKQPGDNKEMIVARRAFLREGYYDGFVTDFVQQFLNLATIKDYQHFLDMGCGEGYFTDKIRVGYHAHFTENTIQFYGIDISKPAIHYAAQAYKHTRFGVGKMNDIPVLDNALDCIISIVAPRDIPEFARVLKPSGLVILVLPGEKHLRELRHLIYEESAHEHVSELGALHPAFSLVKQWNYEGSITISTQHDIENLLKMTPYFWNLSPEKANTLLQLQELSTTISFSTFVLKLSHDETISG